MLNLQMLYLTSYGFDLNTLWLKIFGARFLADVPKPVRELCDYKTEGEKFCALESSAKWCEKHCTQNRNGNRGEKVHDYLLVKVLFAVPFDKFCGFCVMKKSKYRERLEDLLNSDSSKKSMEQKMKLWSKLKNRKITACNYL